MAERRIPNPLNTPHFSGRRKRQRRRREESITRSLNHVLVSGLELEQNGCETKSVTRSFRK